jgi:hypothetical protein
LIFGIYVGKLEIGYKEWGDLAFQRKENDGLLDVRH